MKKSLLSILLSTLILSSCSCRFFNDPIEGENDNIGIKDNNNNENEEKDVEKYKITWIVNDKEVRTDLVSAGKMPSFGSTPYKEPPSATVQYAFSNWEPALEVASKDITYTAIFVEETRKYNISFEINGVIVETKKYEYNETPSFVNPFNFTSTYKNVYKLNDQYMNINKWEPDISPVSKDQKYVADITKLKLVTIDTWYCFKRPATTEVILLYAEPSYASAPLGSTIKMYSFNAETFQMVHVYDGEKRIVGDTITIGVDEGTIVKAWIPDASLDIVLSEFEEE